MTDAPNAAQIDYWNAVAGEVWSKFQPDLDRQIEPLGLEAIRRLDPRPGEHVLDIGCGCGQTTMTLAQRVGATGAVVGADISRPMLEVARARPLPAGAATPQFREADAQSADLTAADLGAASFDAAFSRFGVMFFADPTAAFANIRAALKPSGRLGFVCWRPFDQNPWMAVPMAAAQPYLDPTPPPDPTAPGPFAFADAGRLRGILEAAGFKSIAIDPYDADIGGGDIEQTVSLTFRVGPLGRALLDHRDRVPVVAEAVRKAIEPYATPDGVFMPSAVWMVQARAN
ncbi:MAG TPA: methyltransferase domain-containing protein [Caulobacteraceae bacterium]|jgi:SAM-dependent methyltransferase|nr:methyltransferase domain-containing protein [Caulobacteraceae bacterium]